MGEPLAYDLVFLIFILEFTFSYYEASLSRLNSFLSITT